MPYVIRRHQRLIVNWCGDFGDFAVRYEFAYDITLTKVTKRLDFEALQTLSLRCQLEEDGDRVSTEAPISGSIVGVR